MTSEQAANEAERIRQVLAKATTMQMRAYIDRQNLQKVCPHRWDAWQSKFGYENGKSSYQASVLHGDGLSRCQQGHLSAS